ncbi:MAG: CvpA family protein [Roseibacillus sp.]|nr:CvpA family protein [Roseibacillus sp.]
MLAIISQFDISIFGVIGIIIIIFIVIGLIKGFVRMTFGLIALSAGILASFWGFRHGASIAGTLIENPDPWMSAAVGVILGLAIFFVARALFGILLSPVGSKGGKARKIAPLGGILGLVMGAALVWFCLAGVRYNGTLSELDWVREAIQDKEWLSATTNEDREAKRPPQPIFSKLKRGLDTSTVGQFHAEHDFLNDRSQANLSKLTILVDNEQAATRAYLTKDVRKAARQTQIDTLLVKQSAKLKAFYEEGQYSQLLHSDFIKEACETKEAEEQLEGLDIEKAIGLIGTGEGKD